MPPGRLLARAGAPALVLAAATYGQDAQSFLTTESELFVDPRLPNGDYHLKEGSPAVDAGTAAGAPATDMDGDPRPSGEGVDVGADELFVPPPCEAAETLTLSDDTVTGAEIHVACYQITAGPAYTVAGSGDLTLRARGRVVLADGFAVLAGGRLRIEIDPSAGAP